MLKKVIFYFFIFNVFFSVVLYADSWDTIYQLKHSSFKDLYSPENEYFWGTDAKNSRYYEIIINAYSRPNFPADISSFPNQFKLFIPPGTTYVAVSIKTARDNKIGVVARYKQMPLCQYCSYVWHEDKYYNVPWDWETGVNLDMLKQKDVYLKNPGGTIQIPHSLFFDVPLSENQAGWLYIKKLPFDSDWIMEMHVTIRVDKEKYSNWYNSVDWSTFEENTIESDHSGNENTTESHYLGNSNSTYDGGPSGPDSNDVDISNLNVNFAGLVCAYDINHDGIIEANEYTNCQPQLVCPFDPSLTCSESTTTSTNCVCPPGSQNIDSACITEPACPQGGTLNTTTHRCEITPNTGQGQCSITNTSCTSDYCQTRNLVYQGTCGTDYIEGWKICIFEDCSFLLEKILAPYPYRMKFCPNSNNPPGAELVGKYRDVTKHNLHDHCHEDVVDIYVWDLNNCHSRQSYICSSNGQIYSDLATCQANCNFSQCPSGTTYDSARNICYYAPSCNPGFTFNSSTNTCSAEPQCSTVDTGFTCSRESDPICARPGTLNLERDLCETEPYCHYRESHLISQTFKPEIDSCEIIKRCTDRWECPYTPYHHTGCNYRHECKHYAYPICSVGHYNTSRDRCETSKTCETNCYCPDGTSWDSYHHRCYTSASCPSGLSLNTRTNRCEETANSEHYAYPICSVGHYNTSRDRCETSKTCETNCYCPDGTSWDDDHHRCYTSADCPSGLSLNTRTNRCEETVSCEHYWDCPGYPSVSCNAQHRCTIYKPPQCPSDNRSCCPPGYSYTGPEDNKCVRPIQCEYGSYVLERQRCESDKVHNNGWICDSNGRRYSSRSVCESNCRIEGTCINNIQANKYECTIDHQLYSTMNDCMRNCSGHTQCRYDENSYCPGDYLYDFHLMKCYGEPYCSYDGVPYKDEAKCVITKVRCAGYSKYNYSSASKLCEADISCTEGIYNSDSKKCIIEEKCELREECPFENGSECTTIDFPPDQFPEDDADLSSYDNDAMDETGNCEGQIYIFNGYGRECLLAGVDTGFHNCCDKCDSEIKDDIKSSIVSLGGVAYRGAQTLSKAWSIAGESLAIFNKLKAGDKAVEIINSGAIQHKELIGPISQIVDNGGTASEAITQGLTTSFKNYVMGIDPTSLAISITASFLLSQTMEMLLQNCNADSILTTCYKDLGLCHYVGKYCKKKWPLVGCVQRAKVFCCFNSKLARIVQEQGRPQLETIGNFGAPKTPKCRGFTPEEFQMLDFSKIDLSEWYDDIETRATQEIQQNLEQNVQKFKENALSSHGTD